MSDLLTCAWRDARGDLPVLAVLVLLVAGFLLV